jgi:hypothetical protein
MKLLRVRWLRAGTFLAVGALGIGIALYARAAMNVPTGLAYSGLLRNNGAVEASPHDFAFDLLDGSGTTVCPTDTRTALAVTSGRFDVPDLFSGCATLDDVLETHTGLAIRITVDGTVLTPNQPLGTVPFAARARIAESAGFAQSAAVADGVSGSAVIPIANGGTGASTKTFVDLSTDQSIAGNKTFTGATTLDGNTTTQALVSTTLDISDAGGLRADGVTGMIFGGMYCTDNASTPGTNPGAEMTVHNNPLTGTLGCPSGFTSHALFETGDLSSCSATCGGFKCFYCGR